MGGIRAALVLGLVGACAAGAPSAAKPHVAEAWREIASEHFVVWTNTSAVRARTLIRTMENLRQVVFGVSFFRKEPKGKSYVIAFDSLDEVHRYVPKQFIAQAFGGSPLLQPVIVLAAESLDHDRRIVTHELTHVISFNVIRHQPRWFSEGLAGYFETVRLFEDHATIDVGEPLPDRLQLARDHGTTPIAQLFACKDYACMDDRFYATTWALFTYLLNQHQAELFTYMQRLLDTPEADQDQLWASVFPTLPPDKLDRELATWLHYGKVRVLEYTIKLHDWPVTERAIGPADVLAAKGMLRAMYAPQAAVPAEITQAIALDATNVVANMVDAQMKKSVTPELAASMTAAHPDDWRAWWLAWRAAKTGKESYEARDKTCTLLEADAAAAPIESCARDAGGGFAEDPRSTVFKSAKPQVYKCLEKSKASEIPQQLVFDLEIADSGAVTSAHVTLGSADTNACAEAVLRGLAFPAHHAGPFHASASRAGSH